MNIGFAIAPYQRYSGVGVYYHQLINQIVRLYPGNNYYVYVSAESHADALKAFPAVNVVPVNVPNGPSWKRALYTYRYNDVSGHYGPKSLDLLHSFSFPGFVCRGKNILTVYDMRDEDMPALNRPLRNYYGRFLKRRTLRKFDLLIAISDFTRRRLVHHYPEVENKVRVIHLSGGERFAGIAERSGCSKNSERGQYILAVSHLMPRKNLAVLIRAYDMLITRYPLPHRLLIVGRKYENDNAFDRALHSASFKDRIEIISSLDEEALSGCYREASLFVHPAVYEGFGIPVLEAASFRIPVLASNTSSLPEILEDPECLFDPLDAEGLCLKMFKSLVDDKFRARIIDSGQRCLARFSWETTAEMTYESYRLKLLTDGEC